MDEDLISEMAALKDKTDRYRFVFEIKRVKCFSRPYPRERFLEKWEELKDTAELQAIEYESTKQTSSGGNIWHVF